MSKKRQSYSGEYKGKVALEALRGLKTLAQQSADTGVHANQIRLWKQQVQEGVASLFAQAKVPANTTADSSVVAQLYEEIGRMKMELSWLKKKHEAVD